MDDRPLALMQPLIGFAVWHLSRGWTVQAVKEAMQFQAKKRGWPEQHIDKSLEWALKCWAVTCQANDYIEGRRRAD